MFPVTISLRGDNFLEASRSPTGLRTCFDTTASTSPPASTLLRNSSKDCIVNLDSAPAVP